LKIKGLKFFRFSGYRLLLSIPFAYQPATTQPPGASTLVNGTSRTSHLLDRLQDIFKIKPDSLSAKADAWDYSPSRKHVNLGARNPQHGCDFLNEASPSELRSCSFFIVLGRQRCLIASLHKAGESFLFIIESGAGCAL
jgi:hypothetical protein